MHSRTIGFALRTAVALVGAVTVAGCGHTRWSDSKRTATEQLLVSDAIERAVEKVDLRPLAGRKVFLDTAFMDDTDDQHYLTSVLRHQLLASGCRLASKLEDAEVVVEARAGAIGTDRNDILVGMPATSLQIAGNGTTIPEIAFAKRTDQRGVAKVSLFAYYRESGAPIWHSGEENVASRTRDRWFLGTGPFQDGEIYDEVEFAGEQGDTDWFKPFEKQQTEIASGVDLTKPFVYATVTGGTTPAATTADSRPADLPPVR